MSLMEITNTIKPQNRTEWRQWLAQNHNTLTEIWVLSDDRPEQATIAYLDAVEEALCFGWIDGIAKRFSSHELAQRFTPRKRRSNWTELNKARVRRLIRLELMTAAGSATLPDLDAGFIVAEDIMTVLRANPDVWSNYQAFPDLYRRIRIGYIEEMRKNQSEFDCANAHASRSATPKFRQQNRQQQNVWQLARWQQVIMNPLN
jgi:uncharacterized protein YdeI (YjbR/CyaY-like superfamily)